MIRVSKISLRNFKSFRKVALPIPQGFTAIVGPNGSGKSNIVDALCFVLGRSSAKSLRAERFSDLIFNGGNEGDAATQAEVTLYLDNAGREIPVDSREVRISRTIDSSGNSVYRLNGKRSTRNEILDVLAAAKIQPDGHNIVLQGDITRIIEMSPLERRGLIDEIAGIAEYEGKKARALRELERVSENVSKAEVVLGEVGTQREKLEKEREAAMRHEFLKGEVRRAKYTLIDRQQQRANGELERIEGELKGLGERTTKLERYGRILNLKGEVRKKELEELSKRIVIKEESEQFTVYRGLEKVRNEAKYLGERMEASRREVEALEKRTKEIKASMVSTFREMKACREAAAKLEGEEGSLGGEIGKLKASMDAAYAEGVEGDAASGGVMAMLEGARERLEEEEARMLQLEREAALLGERVAGKERALEGLRREAEEKKSKLEGLHKLVGELVARKKGLEEMLEKGSRDRRELLEKAEELRGKVERTTAMIQVKGEELARASARKKALEEAARSTLDGAVEAVLRLRDEGKVHGIYGTIGELGRVEKKYSRALEVAAGRGMYSVVVEDDGVAEECIKYLKAERIGRATFLPLKNLRVEPPSSAERELARGGHGFALELVRFEKRFEKAFARVFRNTVVVEDIAAARKGGMGNARMVTVDGDLVEPSGVMSGGFYQGREGFREGPSEEKLEKELERLKREREDLLRQEEEARKGLEELGRQEIARAQEVETTAERLRASKTGLEELTEAVAHGEALLKALRSEILDTSRELKARRKALETLVERVGALKREKAGLEGELGTAGAEERLREIKGIEEKVLELEQKRQRMEAQRGLNASKVEEALRPRFEELNRELKVVVARKRGLLEELQSMGERGKELETELETQEGEGARIKEEIEALKGRRDFLARGLTKILRKGEGFREELTAGGRKIEHLRIEKARQETRLEGLQEGLKGYEGLEPLEGVEDLAALEGDIVRMEGEMVSLEPVNMRAIEDFQGIKEKFEGMDQKVKKLQDERDAILLLMEEIDQRKTQVFMEVFTQVALNFQRIFSQLSTGGTAQLLLDEEHPLEGGLQIQARPAGKNPQYIELMSGGEKTITALTFIFAIQRYQPAPFYVMDEIDMFLDDDNVKRVSELIKDASREAQFIVVSLRDSLMASADQLFGVSNEDGVSKIVGVELEEIGGTSPG